MKNKFTPSDSKNIQELESLYYNVVLKQEFYSEEYDENANLEPFYELSKIMLLLRYQLLKISTI